MLRIQGDCLSKEDKKLLKRATIYTMDYLLPRNQRGDSRLIITVSEPDKEQLEAKNKAACSCNIGPTGRKTIRVWLDQSIIRRRAKTHFNQFKITIQDLFHELVHVKQYLKGELVDGTGQYYKFCGKRYRYPKEDDLLGYFEQPYEIEAYGRERGLFKRFEAMLKEEVNA